MVKKRDDAYGAELWDYYKGESHPELVERDDGLIDVGETFSAKVYFSEYKDWSSQDKKATAFVQGKKCWTLDAGQGGTLFSSRRKGLMSQE